MGDAAPLAVEEGDQGVTVRAAAARRDAPADDRQRDLQAPGALVFVFVGPELGAPVDLRGPRGNPGAELQGGGLHPDDEMAALLCHLVAGRTGGDREKGGRGPPNR